MDYVLASIHCSGSVGSNLTVFRQMSYPLHAKFINASTDQKISITEIVQPNTYKLLVNPGIRIWTLFV